MMPNLNDLMSFKPSVALDEPTALYARLSVDDANDGDSNSIVHQKEMLERYCKDNGYTNDPLWCSWQAIPIWTFSF